MLIISSVGHTGDLIRCSGVLTGAFMNGDTRVFEEQKASLFIDAEAGVVQVSSGNVGFISGKWNIVNQTKLLLIAKEDDPVFKDGEVTTLYIAKSLKWINFFWVFDDATQSVSMKCSG